MDPDTLDKLLAICRTHKVRAIKLPDGTAIELEPDMGPILDIPEAVAGGWKRPANFEQPTPQSGIGE